MGIYGILLQFEKAAESSDEDRTCHMFSLEKTSSFVAHLKVAHLKTNFITTI